MQLDQLEFVVKTEQLDTAITKIRKLGEEVSKLPKGGLGGLSTGGGGTRGAGRDVEDYEKKLEKLREQLKFLRNDQELTNLGFTKMQAGMLAAIKVAGAGENTIASFAAEFDKLNKITGQNPFDKSSQGLKKLENDLREIEEVTKYTAQGFKLTSDQVKALSRDLEAMRQRNEALSVSDQEISRLQKEHISLFAQKADQLNKYNAEAARSTAAAKTLANADAKLLEQEQKLAFTNKQLADGLSQGSANALYNYKKQIEALGLSTEQAAKRVASFREQLVIKQGYSPLTKLSKDTEETSKKLDHLSRALGPQITDIFVGLATGQSLLTVALQQGGQIRDQIALSGVASANMGKALSTAAVQMVGSLKDVSVAMGTLLITPFIAGGKAVTDFATKILFTNKTIQSYSLALAMYADGGNKLASSLINVMSKIPMLIGASFAAVTVAVTTLTVAFFVAQKELDNLSKQLILTGGSLGLNKDLALDYAKSLDGVSGSTSQVIAVIQAMAKEGGFLKEEISLVTKSAVDLEKYAGVSIEDTVKAFAKMKEEPVKALLELAKQTGMVSAETLNMVVALEKQGNTSQAAAVAIKALADVHSEQVDRMKRDYSSLGLMLIDVGDWFANLWRQAKGVVYEPTAMEQAVKALQQADIALTEAQKSLNSSENLSVRPSTQAIDVLRQRLDARKNEYVQLIKNQQAENQSRINNVAIADAKKRSLDLEASAMSPIEKAKSNIAKYTTEIAKAEQLIASTKDEQIIKDTLISNLKKSIAKENENIAKEDKKNKGKTNPGFSPDSDNTISNLKKKYEEQLKVITDGEKTKQSELKGQYDAELIGLGEFQAKELALMKEAESEKLRVVDSFEKQYKVALSSREQALKAEAISAIKQGADSVGVNKELQTSLNNLGREADTTYEHFKNLRSGIENAADRRLVQSFNESAKAIRANNKELESLRTNIEAEQALADKAVEIRRATAGMAPSQVDEYTTRVNTFDTMKKMTHYVNLQTQAKAATEQYEDFVKNMEVSPEALARANELFALSSIATANVKEAERISSEYADKQVGRIRSEVLDTSTKRLEEYGKSFEKIFSDMSTAIADFATTGKWNFGDMVKAMVSDLIRFEMQMQMSNLYKGVGGFAGIVGSIFGGYNTGTPGISQTSAVTMPGNVVGTQLPAAANGAYFDGNIAQFAKGGSFTNSIVDSPTLFKFAKGTGLMGEAGPEAIMPLHRGSDGSLGVAASGSSTNVEVVINNSSGAQASASETVDSKGNRRIEVTIGEMAAAEISKSGSTSQNNIRSTFGLQPRLARR